MDKLFEQFHKLLKDIESGYIVKDDIEMGYLNTIPLWQLGLNYLIGN